MWPELQERNVRLAACFYSLGNNVIINIQYPVQMKTLLKLSLSHYLVRNGYISLKSSIQNKYEHNIY